MGSFGIDHGKFRLLEGFLYVFNQPHIIESAITNNHCQHSSCLRAAGAVSCKSDTGWLHTETTSIFQLPVKWICALF